jgi:hypothetical protein
VSGVGHVALAALDGSAVKQSYLPTAPAPCGIAVDPDKEYWADSGDPGSIGRAHGAFAPTQSFVTGVHDPCGVAVTPTYVYWASRAGDASGHVSWSTATGTIGRANLDGSAPDPSFIAGAQSPCGLAVDATVDPSPASYAFPRTRVGSQSAQAFFVRDSSSSPLAVTRVGFAGRDARDFVAIGDSCLVNVTPAAGGCVINVRFVPTLEGPRRASLRVTSSDGTSPTDLALSGVATDPAPPRLLGASVRPATPRLGARNRRRGVAGLTFDYSVSKAARVTFTIWRRSALGLARIGRFVASGRAGRNRARLPRGLVGRLSLPGRYQTWLVARDATGKTSQRRIVRFRVAP